MPISFALSGQTQVNNGQATVAAPPPFPSGLNYVHSTDRIVNQPGLELTQGAVLNGRYKVGGSGSWERPWGPV